MNALLSRYPFLPVVIAFIVGILFSESLEERGLVVIALAIVIVLGSFYKRSLSVLIFLPLGLLYAAPTLLPHDHISNFHGERVDVDGVIYRLPEHRQYGTRFYIEADRVRIDSRVTEASGRVLINVGGLIEGLTKGDRVRFLGVRLREIEGYKNPGGFDLAKFYSRKGIYTDGYVYGRESIVSFGRAGVWTNPFYFMSKTKSRFSTFVRERFPSQYSDIFLAIVVGEKHLVSYEVRDDFSRTGVAHLLTVSGLHVAAIAAFFFFMIKFILKRSERLLLKTDINTIAAIISFVPLFFFTALVGFAIPVTRAFILIAVFLLAMVLKRQSNRLNTLSIAALILLLINPASIYELGFQLSFLAVLGIIFIHRLMPFRLMTFEDKALVLLKTTVGASFATLPLIINSFGYMPLLSLPANLFLIPLVEFFVVPFGIVSLVAFLIGDVLAVPFVYCSLLGIKVLSFAVGWLSGLEYSALTVPPLTAFSWLAYCLTIVAAISALRSKTAYVAALVLFVVFTSSLFWKVVFPPSEIDLMVHFLDSGKRSISVIQFPGGKTAVVDGSVTKRGGTGYAETSVLVPFLLARGITRVDYFFMTPIDDGRLEVFDQFMDRIDVVNFFTAEGKLDGKIWERIADGELRWQNMTTHMEEIKIGGWKLNAVLVTESPMSSSYLKIEQIVLTLGDGNKNILLFTNRVSENVQKRLLDNHREILPSDLIFLPFLRHDSLGKGFLEALSPAVIVTNKFEGHRGLAANEMEGPRILSTSESGAISMKAVGEDVIIETLGGEKIILSGER